MSTSTLKLLIKVALVAGLLYFLSQKGLLSLDATGRALTQWRLILPALAALAACTLLGVVRWQWLLRAQGIHLAWSRTLQLTFIGNFFNIALPGAVSGDFVKAFYVGREVQGKRARAFGSILFDRVSGLSALVLLAGCALAYARVFGFGESVDGALAANLRGEIQFAVILSSVVTVALYFYLFFVREHHDPLLYLLRRLEARVARAGSLTRIYEGLREYHHHRVTVLKALVLSVAIHMGVGWSALQFARALGVEGLVLLEIYIVVPLGMLVTAVPVLPAGVGTGHAAFGYLFSLLGVSRGADVFSLLALNQIMWGAIGGLAYLRFRGHEPSFREGAAEASAP